MKSRLGVATLRIAVGLGVVILGPGSPNWPGEAGYKQAEAAEGVGQGSDSAEIADNSVDEDGDGWLGCSLGFRIRATHPRVLLTQERLNMALTRMHGPAARDPYQRWFRLVKGKADEGAPVELVSLALIYKATGQAKYKDMVVARIPDAGAPSLSELYAADILFDELDDAAKLKIMRRAGAERDVFYYASTTQSQTGRATWGYHGAHGACVALAYAGVFALTDISLSPEVVDHRDTYTFNEIKYIQAAARELSPEGNFFKIENRIAGDPTYNDALPGSPGGMYDNIGYDSSEESASVRLLAEFYHLTGEPRYREFLHDKYRGPFYQNLRLPHKWRYYESDSYAYRAGSKPHHMAQVWNTQSSTWVTQPNVQTLALLHYLYADPKVQWYVDHGVQFERRGGNYDGIYWDLIYQDDAVPESPPSENPTAVYFSGPGLVSMRQDWTDDASFALFIAGEGISRRYEDSNSFILHRKTHVIPHAGARIRNNIDNARHFWYHQRSASKNTIVVYDPDECFDVTRDGTIGPLHSGRPLVDSDNLGGQLFETSTSSKDGCYPTWDARRCSTGLSTRRSGEAPERLFERANVIKFEHAPEEYTYCVGDATHSYTRKIDLFQREFLYLRPDVFVIFDRVRSTKASFKKAWRIHTVDRPVPQGAPVVAGLGMNAFENVRHTTIDDPQTVTYIDSLLPEDNRVVVRGGESVLCNGQPLRPKVDIGAEQVRELDIPRWLEILAVGGDVEGSLTIHGDAEEGHGVSETIPFTGRTMDELTSVPISLTATGLTDTRQHWRRDQWKDFMVRVAMTPSARVRITGNNENTLFGSFPQGNAWQYTIYRDLANSYKHWKRIRRITTADMDVDRLTISLPHYFDTVNAKGKLYSFAPHTDYKDDMYHKNEDLGRYTLDVEARTPRLLDNFLNVICLRDPGQPKPSAHLIQGEGVSGVMVDGRLALFANGPQPATDLDVVLPAAGDLIGVIVDLVPGTTYHWRLGSSRLRLSTTDNGGQSAKSSDMGVLRIRLRPK